MRAHHLRSVLRYAWRAQTIYDVHAPLAYAFLGQVVEDDRHFYAFDQIAAQRRTLARDGTVIALDDHGAGSQVGAAVRRRVRDILRTSGTPPRFGRYLHKAVDFTGARHVLELGTNLGIGTAYLASALPTGGRLVTIDADEQLVARAKATVKHAAADARVSFRAGTFAAELGPALESLGRVDLAFLDGHHEDEPTRRYFAQVCRYRHSGTVVILDDIHWSAGMESAWEWVKARPEVTLTLDLQRWGVAFFDPGVRHRQHLVVAPRAYKPWHVGLFAARVPQAG